MANAGSVRLSGRFKPGTKVRLVKVRDERVLRSEGGEEVDAGKVDKDGVIEFSKGVEVGARYLACGQVDGVPLEVRLRGRAKGDDDPVNAQAPVGNDRTKLADGSFVDEAPEQHQDTGLPEGAVHRGQHQVPKGVIQRSDTPRGQAVPIEKGELEDAAREKSTTAKDKE